MKIIGGQFKGRPIAQPPTRAVRPLSQKARAAIFDIAGPLEGAVVLDAYAGSGAAGLEAISRGANFVDGLEGSRVVAWTIESNIKALGVEDFYQLWVMPVEKWLGTRHLPAGRQDSELGTYDLIIADPPYAQLKEDVLDKLGELLLPGGLMFVSHAGKNASPGLESVSLADRKNYGDSSLSIYQRSQTKP